MALYQCIKFYYIPSILLNICSRQKCDGRTDESVVVDCIPQICTPKGYPPWTQSYKEHLRVDHNSRELPAHTHTHQQMMCTHGQTVQICANIIIYKGLSYPPPPPLITLEVSGKFRLVVCTTQVTNHPINRVCTH